MQAFQMHTAIQPISIQPLQTQQKPCVTEARHNAEKHSLLTKRLRNMSLWHWSEASISNKNVCKTQMTLQWTGI